MQRSNVSRALSRLIGLGIVSKGPTSGRVATYQLNPSIGWKGTAKNHFKALQDARKSGWTVIEGGASKAIENQQDLPFPT